jgi:hypothetical protein
VRASLVAPDKSTDSAAVSLLKNDSKLLLGPIRADPEGGAGPEPQVGGGDTDGSKGKAGHGRE